MYGNTLKVDKNNDITPINDDGKPVNIQTAQQQINAMLSGCTTATSIKKSTNETKRENAMLFFLPKNPNCTLITTVSSSLTAMYAKNGVLHDAFLYHRPMK